MKLEQNYMEIKFKALSINEGFARTVVSSFLLQLNPSLEELNDVKTAVSEAVTNCVVHAYPKAKGDIIMKCKIVNDTIDIEIRDEGIGIADIEKAKEPFYTTKPEQERSGMGFTVMESFMDIVDVCPNGDKGICVKMRKKIAQVKKAVVGE